MESNFSPFSLTKVEMTEWLKGYLKKDEYIKRWYIDEEDVLCITVYTKMGD